jgi:hypothetical protein
MTIYCITARNPKNNDCPQKFKLWKQEGMFLWTLVGSKSIYDVCDLLKAGFTVYSAIEVKGKEAPVKLGVPIEVYLRVVENKEDNHSIDNMKSFNSETYPYPVIEEKA